MDRSKESIIAKKQMILNILGVKTGQEFKVKGFDNQTFYFDDDMVLYFVFDDLRGDKGVPLRCRNFQRSNDYYPISKILSGNEIKPIDDSPKHGYWVKKTVFDDVCDEGFAENMTQGEKNKLREDKSHLIHCSVCNAAFDDRTIHGWRGCPCCLAVMDLPAPSKSEDNSVEIEIDVGIDKEEEARRQKGIINGWISTEYRLPEDSNQVLAYCPDRKGNRVLIARYIKASDIWTTPYYNPNVKWWRPLDFALLPENPCDEEIVKHYAEGDNSLGFAAIDNNKS